MCSLAFSCSCLLPFTTSPTKKKGVVLSFRELFFLHEKPSAVTSSPSSSCEVNILRNESHGEHMRVWMGIPLLDGKTTFRNNKIWQTLNKNTSPYFHSALLVLWPLAFQQRGHFSEYSISRFTSSKSRNGYIFAMTLTTQNVHLTTSCCALIRSENLYEGN